MFTLPLGNLIVTVLVPTLITSQVVIIVYHANVMFFGYSLSIFVYVIEDVIVAERRILNLLYYYFQAFDHVVPNVVEFFDFSSCNFPFYW